MKLPKKTLIRVFATAHAAHGHGIAGTIVGTAEALTYAFRADTDEYYCITYRARRRFLRKPIIEAQATFHPRRRDHMRLMLRHDHPGQRVFDDWADLVGGAGTALQPLSPEELSSYQFAEPLYANWDRQIAAELDIK